MRCFGITCAARSRFDAVWRHRPPRHTCKQQSQSCESKVRSNNNKKHVTRLLRNRSWHTHTHTHTRRKMAAVKAILSEACTKLVLLLETVHPCNYSRSELVKPAKITATVGTQCRKKDSELKLQKLLQKQHLSQDCTACDGKTTCCRHRSTGD